MDKKLRIPINTTSVVNFFNIFSNTFVLGTNIYLLSSGFKSQIESQKREKIIQNLHLASELASSISGIAKVISDVSDKHNVQNAEDL